MRERSLNSRYTREYMADAIGRLEWELQIIREATEGKVLNKDMLEMIAGKERQIEGFVELLDGRARERL